MDLAEELIKALKSIIAKDQIIRELEKKIVEIE